MLAWTPAHTLSVPSPSLSGLDRQPRGAPGQETFSYIHHIEDRKQQERRAYLFPIDRKEFTFGKCYCPKPVPCFGLSVSPPVTVSFIVVSCMCNELCGRCSSETSCPLPSDTAKHCRCSARIRRVLWLELPAHKCWGNSQKGLHRLGLRASLVMQ